MKALEPKHYALMASLAFGVAAQLRAAHEWMDVITPGFVAGFLTTVGTALVAIFVGAPGASAELDKANQNTDIADARTRAVLAQPDVQKTESRRFTGPIDVD